MNTNNAHTLGSFQQEKRRHNSHAHPRILVASLNKTKLAWVGSQGPDDAKRGLPDVVSTMAIIRTSLVHDPSVWDVTPGCTSCLSHL
jgi:hypothetical protein